MATIFSEKPDPRNRQGHRGRWSVLSCPGLVLATACVVLLSLRASEVAAEPQKRDTIVSEGSASTTGAGTAETRASDQSVIERDVAIRMRDGVLLYADVFRPAGKDARFPVLVYRTPYGKTAAAESYKTHLKAVQRGYAVVLQDVRGRYTSEGEFDPYRNEGRDGYDTIEWAAEQDWSNGVVGTFGLSYPGAVQWLAAIEDPPHLKAMAPAMTFASPRQFFYMNGTFDLSWLPWIYQNVAPDRRARRGLRGITSAVEARRTWPQVSAEYRGWLPLAGLPYLREEAPFYFEWLQHPPEDPWWDWAELRGKYERTSAAVLNLSGWYDEAYGPQGAVTNFTGLGSARDGEESHRTHLVLGPWTHGVHAISSQRAGDVDFGSAARMDYDHLILDFFDHYLRGLDNGFSSEAAVRYFVMGENRWRRASTWPPEEVDHKVLYLHAGASSRRLAEQVGPVNKPSSSFVSDPERPVVDPYAALGAYDYRQLASRDDVLIFDSEPMEQGLAIAGEITATIHASCDCRDFDLWVRVHDVSPDGSARNLMSPGNDVIRASYREAQIGRQLLDPGNVYELRLPGLTTANAFGRGHRIRMQISASFAPHFSPNLQTGKSEITSGESKQATIRIWHTDAYPSRIELPVLP